MNMKQLLEVQAETAYKEFLESIEGLTQEQAWARIECQPGEYLHSEGSILSIVAHVAGGKLIYGSVGYRDLEIRYRDIIVRMESAWPDWERTKQFLTEAHAYWIDTWKDEEDFDRLVKNHRGRDIPSWQVINTVSHHDSYHAGQIQVLRSVLPPSSTPPPDEGDLWREACKPTYAW